MTAEHTLYYRFHPPGAFVVDARNELINSTLSLLEVMPRNVSGVYDCRRAPTDCRRAPVDCRSAPSVVDSHLVFGLARRSYTEGRRAPFVAPLLPRSALACRCRCLCCCPGCCWCPAAETTRGARDAASESPGRYSTATVGDALVATPPLCCCCCCCCCDGGGGGGAPCCFVRASRSSPSSSTTVRRRCSISAFAAASSSRSLCSTP